MARSRTFYRSLRLWNRMNEVQSSINSTRSTHTEIVKTMESMRRENVSQIEQTQIRLRQEMTDQNNQIVQRTSDKIDRLRDDMEYRTKENEKVNSVDWLDYALTGWERWSSNEPNTNETPVILNTYIPAEPTTGEWTTSTAAANAAGWHRTTNGSIKECNDWGTSENI